MSTTSITHRPAPLAAAAATAVAAVLALGAVVLSHDGGSPTTPGGAASHQVDPFRQFQHFDPLKGGSVQIDP